MRKLAKKDFLMVGAGMVAAILLAWSSILRRDADAGAAGISLSTSRA